METFYNFINSSTIRQFGKLPEHQLDLNPHEEEVQLHHVYDGMGLESYDQDQ